MILGIMSDSHDNMGRIKKSAQVLKDIKVDYLIHAGDFVAPFSIEPLSIIGAKEVFAVYGNNDGEKEGLKTALGKINGIVERPPYKFSINGFGILLMHEPYFVADGLNDKDVQMIIHGHTHRQREESRNDTLIINPGEVCGYLTRKSSICFYDTISKSIEFKEF